MKMSRMQKETDNISFAETCSPTNRLHFAVDRNDCTDVAHHTENECAYTGISLSLLLKYHGSFITNPPMTLTPAATKLEINGLEGESILQTNPSCHSHSCVTTSL